MLTRDLKVSKYISQKNSHNTNDRKLDQTAQPISDPHRAIYLKELCQLGQHYVPVADWSNPIT